MFRYLFQFKKTLLIIGDIVIVYAAITISLFLRYGASFNRQMLKNYFIYFSFLLPIFILILYINNLYDFKKTKNRFSFYLAILKAVLLNFFIISAYFYFTSPSITPKTILFIFSAVFMLLLLSWRYSFNLFLRLPKLKKNTVLIGTDRQDKILAKEINDHPEYGYRLAYVIGSQNINTIKNILDGKPINTIILGSGVYNSPEIINTLYRYRNPEHEFINTNDFYEKIIQKIPLTAINEIWFLENINDQKLLYDFIKRIMDIFLSLIMGIALLILLIPLAIAIKLDSPGPIIYRQKRIGKNGKEFTLIKFRSMMTGAETNGALWTEKNDPRITGIGKFMRKVRLDELPQAINIIKGEMSFIGPRPERPEFQKTLNNKIPFFAERNLVKPGLTGWAQTMYRYTSTINDTSEKLQYDLYYIKKRSLSLDLAILIKTINIILEKKGV